MSWPFTYRFVFIHNQEKSREYRWAWKCISDALSKIARPECYYQIDPGNGEGYGRPRTRRETAERLNVILRNHPMAQTIHVITVDKDTNLVIDKLRFRVLRSMPAPADVPGTPRTKQFVAFLLANPQWEPRLAGTVACKPDSDHNKGAAVDVFDTTEHMIAMRDFAVRSANDLGVKYVILFDRIWTAGPPWTTSSRGYHRHTGTYHNHIHVSFRDGLCGVFCSPGYGECG